MRQCGQTSFTREISGRDSAGFTLIEIILFFALSSLFLLIAFNGISNRNAVVQFTDSMRSLQSSLQSEITQLINGTNLATSPPSDCSGSDVGASGDCILIGKVIEFTDSEDFFKTDVLYGDYLDLEEYDDGDVELLVHSQPRLAGVTGQTDIKWQAEFTGKGINDPSIGDVNRLGLLRSPRSTRIIPIVYQKAADIESAANYQVTSVVTAIDDEVNTFFCFEGVNGQVAAITFGSDSGNAKIDLEFDKTECET